MRFAYEVIVNLPGCVRRFEVFAKDEREAFERVSHALRADPEPLSVVFVCGAVAPRGAW